MIRQRVQGNADPQRLRVLLTVLFLGLAIPAALLIRQAFNQLELDAFRQQQLLAENLVQRIDGELIAAFRVEDARAIEDFSFSGAGSDAAAATDRRSPLARLPVASPVPGALGHFQVDAAGSLTTPLLPSGVDPSAYGLSEAELRDRGAVAAKLLDVLAENRLIRGRAFGDAADRTAPNGDGAGRAEPAGDVSADGESGTNDADPERIRAAAPAAFEPPAPEATLADQSESDAGAERAVARISSSAAPEDEPPLREEETLGQAGFDRLARRDRAETVAELYVPEESAELRPAESRAGELRAGRVRAAETQIAAADEQQDRPAPGAGGSDSTESPAADTARSGGRDLDATVVTFQSELEPLVFSGLDTGDFVLFRNAWRDGERFIQGLLIDGETFVDQTLSAPFTAAGLAPTVRLAAATGTGRGIDIPAAVTGTGTDRRQSLFTARLSPPFADIELRFTAGDLEPGAGADLLTWTAIVLFVVLTGGTLAMYRFGIKQIELARQQQNFVSAVSHELKTPLTSIRMYGEMLKSGWASEEKKKTYYEFIYAEGERLSRLIDNVLTLARLNRGARAVTLETVAVPEVIDLVRSKVSTQAEQADFGLTFEADESIGEASVRVDADAVAQIFINLVDNALKFAGGAERREIVISARAHDGDVLFSVRDFGPGIPAADMRRLFELFYRPENELTRTTTGTGIGLALVRELMSAMGGRVDMRNCDPGAEFRLLFPVARGPV